MHLRKDAIAKNERGWTSYPRNATSGACSGSRIHRRGCILVGEYVGSRGRPSVFLSEKHSLFLFFSGDGSHICIKTLKRGTRAGVRAIHGMRKHRSGELAEVFEYSPKRMNPRR